MTMVARMPSNWQTSATAWAWLPDEKVSTPAGFFSGGELADGVERAAKLERADAL
jgi:hypothetical protein